MAQTNGFYELFLTSLFILRKGRSRHVSEYTHRESSLRPRSMTAERETYDEEVPDEELCLSFGRDEARREECLFTNKNGSLSLLGPGAPVDDDDARSSPPERDRDFFFEYPSCRASSESLREVSSLVSLSSRPNRFGGCWERRGLVGGGSDGKDDSGTLCARVLDVDGASGRDSTIIGTRSV